MKLKKLFALASALLLSASLFTACATDTSAKTLKIGVIQFADHPSLENCYEGLLTGLKNKGFEVDKNLEVDYQVGQAKTDLTNQIVKNFVSRQYDLIVGIATPAAQAAYNAAADQQIPVVFTAVTDPITAQLQNEDGSTKEGVTGTSDILPVQEQLDMIRAFLPDAQKIGILYTTSEANSASSVKLYEKLAPAMGFEIVAQGIAEAGDIPAASTALVAKVDVLTNLTDNTVVQNQQIILEKTNAAGIPYFGSEEEQVRVGLTAAAGLDYIALGITTGEMTAEILNGKAAQDVPVAYAEKAEPFINSEALEKLGITVPEAYKDAEDMG